MSIVNRLFCVLACEVSFDNVPVPVENVIGEVGGGFKVRVTLAASLSHSL